ncbi:sensor histidine kinase [Puia dinghuensis]|uniref:sensor histidine kinase n=1 Tax=Puia dinghuensis TaxID=1792502 RepID=UPI00166993E1|nr:histidine kinase [Puia dinghuensis]
MLNRIACPLIIVLLLACCSGLCQEYTYTHYNVPDGLAGSTVYCITQDRDGFIWLGTETGVSRFDGTHFRNFTTADGLPDIEVLQMYGDSRGRVWMAPFRKSVCFYYKGMIHDQKNDPVLRQLHLGETVDNFAEDAAGDILIQQRTSLYVIDNQGRAVRYDSINGRPIRDCIAACRSRSGHFNIEMAGQVYELTVNRFRPVSSMAIQKDYASPNMVAMNRDWVLWISPRYECVIHSFRDGREMNRTWARPYFQHIAFSLVGDSLLFTNEATGALEYNLYTGESKRLLPGQPVSRAFRDESGNLWFSTMGQGIFRLNSNIRMIPIHTGRTNNPSIHAISLFGDDLLIGDDHNSLLSVNVRNLKVEDRSPRPNFKNRILFIDTVAERWLIGSDFGVSLISRKATNLNAAIGGGFKSICKKANGDLLVGFSWGAALLDGRSLRLIDTLWRERTTAVFARRDTAYIGTLNGLYRVDPDCSVKYLGEKTRFLQQRIAAMAADSTGMLWIASYDGGIIGYRKDSVIVTLTRQQGLTSNICRNLFLRGNRLWVGTDKGLNVIRLDKPGYPITQYTSKDGLPSDIINVVYADSSMVYVGTPAGLCFFDASKPNVSEDCRLRLLSVLNENRNKIDDTASLSIPYKDKFLRLEFAGISYRSVGDITYHYRMLGLDSIWRETKETFLEYPTLPSGNYVFQLSAVNKFGISSPLLTLPFDVATPFWLTTWFRLLCLAVFLLLVWLLVSWRIRTIRRRQDEKMQLTARIVDAERVALQAQMNPHFLFNCLNSIQHYVFSQDIYAANKYIAGFARLVRSTLQHSTDSFILLSDEISYLNTYLSLEKLRFKEKMDYLIEVDPDIDKDDYVLPPMLIQPFVENSMRHGLRHKTDGQGLIRLRFKKADAGLVVIVEDNGIGRQKAATFKTPQHIEYQSKGMSLTGDRISMLNTKYNNNIRLSVTDLKDAGGEAAGTQVVLEFPLFYEPAEK